ncbi:Imm3 family immunity protein [Paenibacillus sp. FSL M7-0420]|uniref:Imm3 family immunity protein n=2 Tax=unclassified Paenibacillus TaxID=185978 RepID=UPI0030FA16C5
MKTNLEQAKERILGIDWKIVSVDKPSHVILVTEFIRRGNMFLDFNSKDNNRRAVFNASEIIDFRMPDSIKEENSRLLSVQLDWTTEYLCDFYLEWAYAMDKEVLIAHQFHDLYDPIIKLFERGGRISYHHNELICGNHAWGRSSGAITRDIPPQDISDEALDRIDDDNGEHMKEWNYTELSEYIREVFNNSISDGLNTLQAGGRCLYELSNVIEEGEVEKIIFYVCLADLQIDKGVVSQRILDEVNNIIKDFNIDKFANELETEDIEDLSRLAHKVKGKLCI